MFHKLWTITHFRICVFKTQNKFEQKFYQINIIFVFKITLYGAYSHLFYQKSGFVHLDIFKVRGVKKVHLTIFFVKLDASYVKNTAFTFNVGLGYTSIKAFKRFYLDQKSYG